MFLGIMLSLNAIRSDERTQRNSILLKNVTLGVKDPMKLSLASLPPDLVADSELGLLRHKWIFVGVGLGDERFFWVYTAFDGG